MAVYCKALANKIVLLATFMFPGRHYQLKIKIGAPLLGLAKSIYLNDFKAV